MGENLLKKVNIGKILTIILYNCDKECNGWFIYFTICGGFVLEQH